MAMVVGASAAIRLLVLTGAGVLVVQAIALDGTGWTDEEAEGFVADDDDGGGGDGGDDFDADGSGGGGDDDWWW